VVEVGFSAVSVLPLFSLSLSLSLSPSLSSTKPLTDPLPQPTKQVEVAHLLHFYHEKGLAEAPSASQVEKLRSITNGSGTDLRRLGPRTAQLDTNVL